DADLHRDRGPELRQEDRPGLAGRGPGRPGSDRGLPGGVRMTARLELDEVVIAYGATEVVHSISLRVDEGEMVALLGANGAGKTSTLRAISNIGVRIRGALRFEGRDITGMPGADI